VKLNPFQGERFEISNRLSWILCFSLAKRLMPGIVFLSTGEGNNIISSWLVSNQSDFGHDWIGYALEASNSTLSREFESLLVIKF
jgi:hypothetical protein